MTDAVHTRTTTEGITMIGTTDGNAVTIDPTDTTPRRVYSLDGLLALALAVHSFEDGA